MFTKDQIAQIFANITYKNWKLYLGGDDARLYLQIRFDATDLETGVLEEQRCRKCWLSPHMTHSELVQTAFHAIEAAERHEMREHFKYKGKAIYNPHQSVEALFELHDQIPHDVRSKL